MRTLEVQFEAEQESFDLETLRLDAEIGRIARAMVEVAPTPCSRAELNAVTGEAVIEAIIEQRNNEAWKMWQRQQEDEPS